MAINENFLGTRHGFVTIVLDLDSMAIVPVLKGRGKQALRPFFAKLKQAKAKVIAVATDTHFTKVARFVGKGNAGESRFHSPSLTRRASKVSAIGR